MAGNRIELPKDKDLAAKVITAQSREIGWLGHVFGTKEHAPTNIAALALILLILLLAFTLFAPLAAGVESDSIVTALFGAITFTLGLMFGRTTSRSSED